MTYYPSFLEFFTLGLGVLITAGGGMLFTRSYRAMGDVVPLRLAGTLAAASFVVYLIIVGALYRGASDNTHRFKMALQATDPNVPQLEPAEGSDAHYIAEKSESGAIRYYWLDEEGERHSVPEPRTLQIFIYSIVFGIIPVAFYGKMLLDSISVRSVKRIATIDALSDEHSEFNAAEKLAFRGDIDGAIRKYRSYTRNRLSALFEAARLLESEGRVKDAAAMYNEIGERFRDNSRAWCEAAFRLARIQLQYFDEEAEAEALLKQVVTRAPNSQFGILASGVLHEVGLQGRDLLSALDDAYGGEKIHIIPVGPATVKSRTYERDDRAEALFDPAPAKSKPRKAAAKKKSASGAKVKAVAKKPTGKKKAAKKKPVTKKAAKKKAVSRK